MTTDPAVLVIGGGVAGLSAGLFTARHGLDTTIIDGGHSLLRRNAHLENYPGFPPGINARLLLEMMADQACSAGGNMVAKTVEHLAPAEPGFLATTTDHSQYRADVVIVATKNEVDFLDQIDGLTVLDRGKAYLEVDDRGRTGIEGLYAAGRLAGIPHQAIVAAGHGATVGITVLEDIDRPFYHDWVTPEGYFTGRDREIPPGCEEISIDEFRRREAKSIEVMQDYFSDPHPALPVQHPSVRSEPTGANPNG